jgi:hypothetical protein
MWTVVELERILLVIRNIRHGGVVRVSQIGTVLRMWPMRTMMVQKPGITHCRRLIWGICPVWPVRTKRPLVVGDGGSQVALTRYPHDSAAVGLSIHLVRQKRLQRRYLVQHGVDLRQVLSSAARAGLEVQTGTPVRGCTLADTIGRPEGEILLDAIWHVGLGRHWQEDVLGRVWLLRVLDRSAIVRSRQDAVGRLSSQHVLWRLRGLPSTRALRVVRVVARQRVGILLRRGILGEVAACGRRSIAQRRWMGGRRWEGVEQVRRLRLWGALAHHGHDDVRRSFTKTGWCRCLRGIVACLLRLTYLSNREQSVCTPGVCLLARHQQRPRPWEAERGRRRRPGGGCAGGVVGEQSRSGGVRCGGGVSGRLMRAPCLPVCKGDARCRRHDARLRCAEWIAPARGDRRREKNDALWVDAAASALRDLGAHWKSRAAERRAGQGAVLGGGRSRQASRLCAASSRADASFWATESAGVRRVMTSCSAAETSQQSFNSGCRLSLL